MTWARKNLFSSWANTLLTITVTLCLAWVAYRLGRFVFVTGRWEIIRRNLTLILVRVFPRTELWRVWAALYVLFCSSAVFAGSLRRRAMQLGTERMAEPATLRRVWPVLLLVGMLTGGAAALQAAAE
ncbi:MAG: hypothetical protein WD826_07735, partial [Actinomycetota bacterium]